MSFFRANDGTQLYFEDAGEGLPVLCLAGLTRNSRDFDFVAPHLTGVRLIRMDYRGRGLSDNANPLSYSVMQEGADALALLDHLGIAKAAVLGTSRGGLIAMTLAALSKNRLLGAALNDVGPVLEPAFLTQLADFIGLDVCLSILNVMYDGFKNPKYAPCPLLVNMVMAEKKGVKSGEGFYDYSESKKAEKVSKQFS